MFKFGHVDMEKKENPIVWDLIPRDDFDLIMKCKNLYEWCMAYSGRNIHEVRCAAGNLLNGGGHFLLSFTRDFAEKKARLDEGYEAEGGWTGHTRKFLAEKAVPRALKALNALA